MAARIVPLPLPESILSSRPGSSLPVIDLERDTVIKHLCCCQAPSGNGLYVLSSLFYFYGTDDYGVQHTFNTFFISRFDSDLRLQGQADLSQLTATLQDFELSQAMLAVTPEGLVVFSTTANRVYFLEPTLAQGLGGYADFAVKDRSRVYANNFASQMACTETGQWFCLVAEPGVTTVGFSPNLVAVSQAGPLSPQHRPPLRSIASLKSTLPYEPNCRFSYIQDASGGSVGTDCRPSPTLVELAEQQYSLRLYEAWLHQIHPLTEQVCLVSLYHKLMRGGTKECDYLMALVSAEGRLVGRLEGLEESPYVDHHYNLAVDPRHSRVVYRSSAALYWFSFQGKVLARVELGSDWKKFRLFGCSRQGEIYFMHPEQNCLLRLDPVEGVEHLSPALEAALAQYKSELARLKKTAKPTRYRWVNRLSPIFRH